MTTAIDVLGIVAAVLIPTVIFLYGAYNSMKKGYLAKQIDMEKKLDKVDDTLNKLDNSISKAHLRINQVETDHKRIESAFEVQLNKVNDKLEKIFDLLVSKRI